MKEYRTAKIACYLSCISMSVAANISPLLFLTFRELYGISYTLLGLLVLVNFCTQLGVDLIFSFFSHRLPLGICVRATPVLSVVGLVVFALAPSLFPGAEYACLLVGTFLFSIAAGLGEVLTSPVIAAIPSENPEAEMSRYHSSYAWGTVAVVVIGTLFLELFDNSLWQVLVLMLTLIPLSSAVCFLRAKLPPLETAENAGGTGGVFRNAGVLLCVLAIFMGGAAECTMSQWASGYLEMALGIPKMWGDIFGVAMFALALGLGRTLYAKYGKNTFNILILGSFSAAVCYLVAALSPLPVVGLIACALTGLCTAMLWPGNLIVSSEHYPSAGVALYALMAAGGDLGASVAPQLVGSLTDAVAKNPSPFAALFGEGLASEQVGMRVGILMAALFPLLGTAVLLVLRHYFKRHT
ncbi:MAG: MFS transporter [Clostridia bacterium]|nr:MFS transporter [Clostridia bacterium]